jgi:hypothetical protein
MNSMNKKTTVIYVYLALFAFTLGFSFTLASQAWADGRLDPGCCFKFECEGHEELVTIGHMYHNECLAYPLTDCHDFTPVCPNMDPPGPGGE